MRDIQVDGSCSIPRFRVPNDQARSTICTVSFNLIVPADTLAGCTMPASVVGADGNVGARSRPNVTFRRIPLSMILNSRTCQSQAWSSTAMASDFDFKDVHHYFDAVRETILRVECLLAITMVGVQPLNIESVYQPL